jgi:hypothetical protein
MTDEEKENHRMGTVVEEKLGVVATPRSAASGLLESSGDKYSQQRLANKQRKKRAHRRKLRRSNTNG